MSQRTIQPANLINNLKSNRGGSGRRGGDGDHFGKSPRSLARFGYVFGENSAGPR
jgi:hypothetical protein